MGLGCFFVIITAYIISSLVVNNSLTDYVLNSTSVTWKFGSWNDALAPEEDKNNLHDTDINQICILNVHDKTGYGIITSW